MLFAPEHGKKIPQIGNAADDDNDDYGGAWSMVLHFTSSGIPSLPPPPHLRDLNP